MKKSIFPALLLLSATALEAQPVTRPRTGQLVDVTGTIGQSEGTAALSYVYNWRLGKQRKWEIGAGLRFTAYNGRQRNFTTAPARLSRSTTLPFVIVFAGQETKNWDTLTVRHPQVNSLNTTINIGYHLTSKWLLGFNIDATGVSFGRHSNSVLTSNGVGTSEPDARPASFNLLLTGDNDYGSLDSEFFLDYQVGEHWAVKGVYGFYFAEYKTNTVKQTAPDGTQVDRFRNKVNSLGLGIAYHF